MEAEWTEGEIYGPLLERAGITTKRTLYRGARHVSLMLRDGVITLSAMDYDGPGAWEGVKSREDITLPQSANDAELGAAVRQALAMSRPGG